jgi:hypothetical protein
VGQHFPSQHGLQSRASGGIGELREVVYGEVLKLAKRNRKCLSSLVPKSGGKEQAQGEVLMYELGELKS